MEVRAAGYKYTKKAVNAGISLWTWLPNRNTPPYSHYEIGIQIAGRWEYFSSTMRGGSGGTRWIKEKDLFKHPERWDVHEFEVDEDEVNIIKYANRITPRGYDFWGLAGFITPFGLINSKEKWYCSEACYYVLTGLWKRRISPRRFYSYLKKTYLKMKKVSLDNLAIQ